MTSIPQPRLFREGHALVIGVGAYVDPAWNAPTAEHDARALYQTLTDPAFSAYPSEQVELLLGPDATRAGVLDALGRLARRARQDSTALVVFTGHGALGDDGPYYLATHDTRFSGAQIARGTGVSVRDLALALRAVPAKQLLLALNACFSGVAGAKLGTGGIGRDPGSVLPEEQGAEVVASGEGRAIITASRAEQRSYFSESESLSFFGQALVDALRGSGVPDAGGYIGLYELYNVVYRQTMRAAAQIGLAQNPLLTVLQASGTFPLARYRGSPDAGDLRALADRPAGDTAAGVRQLPPIVQNVGPGGAAVGNVGDHSSVRVSSGLITFGDNVQAGNITIGDVAAGDIIKSTVTYGGSSAQAAPADPLADLPAVAGRLATARNVDELAREDAAHNLRQAHALYRRGDISQARARLDTALGLMYGMGNGFVTSLARKVEAAREALG